MTPLCFMCQHSTCQGCNCSCHARSLFDLPAHQRHSDTSYAAAVAILPNLNALEVEVLGYLQSTGSDGSTDEEGIESLHMNPSTYRPRRIDLVDKHHMVKDSGRRRRTHSGRWAVVWVVTT